VDRTPTADVGIVGMVTSDPEVTAVFPTLSSTVLTHSQEIRFFRGDSLDIAVTIQDDSDPADPVRLENCILRWAAKHGHGLVPTSLRNRVILGNESALLVKTSDRATEIEIVSEAKGHAVIHLEPTDTFLMPGGVPAIWDLELVKATHDVPIPPGSVAVSAGSNTVMSLSVPLNWTTSGLRLGDLLRIQGKLTRIVAIDGPQHLRVSRDDWSTEVTSNVVAWRSKTKTVAYGSFVVLGDVVR